MTVQVEHNPLLEAMGVASGADRVSMDIEPEGVTVTFWSGETKCERFFAPDDKTLDGPWEDVAFKIGTDARELLSA